MSAGEDVKATVPLLSVTLMLATGTASHDLAALPAKRVRDHDRRREPARQIRNEVVAVGGQRQRARVLLGGDGGAARDITRFCCVPATMHLR